jgi:hypothetical protein
LIRFTEHLTEAFKAKSGKNVHLEHLEDEILNSGYAGFSRAVSAIRGVLDVFGANEPTTYDITVKWDGAPAIICGIDPSSGRFFVGTKSVFNVTPKINFTNADIDANHPADGLNAKLKLALKHFSKLGIRGVLQGDLLFDSDTVQRETIDGKRYLTFRPNTITYAVDPKSELGKRIAAAKIGIVFHTAYEGDSLQTMTARFNPDISYLKKTRDVWYDNATLRVADGSGLFSARDRQAIERSIDTLTQQASALKTTMNGISRNEGVKLAIKTYINGLVRANMGSGHADVNQLLAMMAQKAQSARKKPSTKPTPSMEWIKRNRNQINQVFALHNALTVLKMSIVSKLSSLKGGMGTFVKDGKGYRVTAPEGYVAIDRMSNAAVKLVDRLDFSRSNFTVDKSWKKE